MITHAPPEKDDALADPAPAVDKSVLLRMYRNIYATRRFELKCIELYRLGLIRGYLHPYLGQEAIAAGACEAIGGEGTIVSTHRGHGHCISKGADLKRMMAEIMGRETGYCKGRGGSMHISSRDHNNLGANGIVGGGIPIGTGAAMGIKIKQSKQVVVAFFSDGASNNGVCGESLNLAAIYDLPIIYMLENNHYAVTMPVERASACCELAKRSQAYGMPGICIDGNDAVEVYLETQKAAKRAADGQGPTLIEARTYRHGGHHVNDPGLYMDPDIVAAWKARDPLILLGKRLRENQIKEIEIRVDDEIEEAVSFAKNSPEPSIEAFLQEIDDDRTRNCEEQT